MAKDEDKYRRDKEWEFAQFLKNEKAKYAEKHHRNFWSGKTPCWEITSCPDSVKNECPAPKHHSLPCWQIEGTYCKLDERSASGLDTSICKQCQVYEQYGGHSPLKIKLFTSAKDHRPGMLNASSEGKGSNPCGPR